MFKQVSECLRGGYFKLLCSLLWLTLTGTGRGEAKLSQSTTTCEEFERAAPFNSYDITESKWKIIYFCSETTELRSIIFSLIDKKTLNKFETVVDAVQPDLNPEWHKATLMMEPRPVYKCCSFTWAHQRHFKELSKWNIAIKDAHIRHRT
ncbi:uncharacterized protein LOC123867249 [Maniola jurtina]|uniref:uncharacterized protein LOC123867249 n=1 Tax=Maniola jurtina TaxID=191418 RepID=UPI001E686C45|nr:uncharacterized protein LOC123867249 [Maniola jurtina]